MTRDDDWGQWTWCVRQATHGQRVQVRSFRAVDGVITPEQQEEVGHFVKRDDNLLYFVPFTPRDEAQKGQWVGVLWRPYRGVSYRALEIIAAAPEKAEIIDVEGPEGDLQ